MINFRYHVVSLVAVFLALGLGVLMGSSFISEGTVKLLQRTQRGLEKTNDRLKNDLRTADRNVSALGEFAGRSRDSLVRGTLPNRPVLILSFENTPEDAVKEVATTLQQAGARIEGSLQLSQGLDGTTDAKRKRIALALETSATDETELRSLLVNRLSGTLTGKGPGLLQRMVEADLAKVAGVSGAQLKAPSALPSPGSALVFFAGKADGRSTMEQQFALPLIRSLAGASAVIAVCEPDSETMELAGPLRDDPSLKIVTVDGVAGPVGQAGLALGLQAAFAGRFGHYGSGKGASSLLPERPS